MIQAPVEANNTVDCNAPRATVLPNLTSAKIRISVNDYHPKPSLLEQQVHPKILGVPEKMVARFEKPVIPAIRKVTISQKVLATLVQQADLIHLDHAYREPGCRGKTAPACG